MLVPCNNDYDLTIFQMQVYKQRANPDEEMLSMISPEEWGPSGPEYVGGYRLEFDMSWTELKDCDKRGNEIQMINKILDTSQVRELREYIQRPKRSNGLLSRMWGSTSSPPSTRPALPLNRRKRAKSTQKCFRTPSGSDLWIVPYPMLPELFWQIVIDFALELLSQPVL